MSEQQRPSADNAVTENADGVETSSDAPALHPAQAGSERRRPPKPPAAPRAGEEDAHDYRARPPWLIERLLFVIYMLSYWTARLLGRRGTNLFFGWLTRLLGPLSSQHKRGMHNFDLVRPSYSQAERRQILQGVYTNFARSSFEYAFLKDLLRDSEKWRVEGLEHFHAARAAAGGRMVIASAHFGNWEAIRAVAAREGAPLGLIYRAFNNKLVDQHVFSKMRSLGWPVFRKGRKGGRDLVKHVRSGAGALILVDQRLGGGPIIDFMGRPAETSIAAAQLARTMKAPLLTASARRLPNDDFVVRFDPPVVPARPDEMMAEINQRIESWVDEAPAQWLWVHRRWKVRQTGLRKFAKDAEAADTD